MGIRIGFGDMVFLGRVHIGRMRMMISVVCILGFGMWGF